MNAPQSPQRNALIIANWQFKDPGLKQLAAPPQDADNLARVLGSPDIGFEVIQLLNKPSYEVCQAIEAFFKKGIFRRDLLLLYFSGHGFKGEGGELYYATTDTKLDLPNSTTVSADFINYQMKRSKSKRQVLLLDCCYSGLIAHGMKASSNIPISIQEQFEGSGRFIITASNSIQYAFEGGSILPHGVVRSVFTHFLIQGLEKLNDDGTWEADKNKDGRISLDELFNYVDEHVREHSQHNQTPQKWALEVEGEIFIAQNAERAAKVIELPEQGVIDELPRLPLATPEEIKQNLETEGVVNRIIQNEFVFFLGWDINLFNRSAKADWQPEQSDVLPSMSELSTYLSQRWNYPLINEQHDFSHVSQFIVDQVGSNALSQELIELLDKVYPLTPLHHFFAQLPATLLKQGCSCPYSLIITTNYDNALERAFEENNQPFDLVYYVPEGEGRGKVVHCSPNREARLIEQPNQYIDISLKERSVILKICGTLRSTASHWNGFAVGQDLANCDYISIRSLPVSLIAELFRHNVLFLGCRLQDWNLRNFLRHIWGDSLKKLGKRSLWIEPSPRILDTQWLERSRVRVLSATLEESISELFKQLMLPGLPSALEVNRGS